MKVRNIIKSLIILLLLTTLFVSCYKAVSLTDYTKYQCDVKLFHWATTINIDKDSKDFATVRGNIFKFVTDPLTMYDLEENKVAYAGDDYHFFAQDSHTIFVDNCFSVEMVGLVSLFGEAYDIYNSSGEKIASVSFGPFDTYGSMYDMEHNLIAEYNSFLFFNDFTVKISENCPIDEKTILMIFCSYYSDQSADATSSSHINDD